MDYIELPHLPSIKCIRITPPIPAPAILYLPSDSVKVSPFLPSYMNPFPHQT